MGYLKRRKSKENREAIVVIGCAGCGNRGDDLILEGIKNTLGLRYRIIPACGEYEDIKAFMGEDAMHIPAPFFRGVSVSVVFNMVPFFGGYIISLLTQAKAVVIGGGSLLHGLTRYNLPFYYLISVIAKALRKPVYYVGVGIGPLKISSSKRYLLKILKLADGVFVREKKDIDLLVELGYDRAHFSADLAFASGRSDTEIMRHLGLKQNEYVVMTASQWFQSDNFWKREEMDFSRERELLVNSVKRLYRLTNKKILFMPTVAYDYELGEELKKSLDDISFEVLPTKLNCIQMSTIIGNAYLVYGMRMHSLIMATRTGIPFVATIYDEKVRSFLDRINRQDCVVAFSDIDTVEFDSQIEYVKNNYERIKSELLISSSNFREIIERDMNLIIQEIRRT